MARLESKPLLMWGMPRLLRLLDHRKAWLRRKASRLVNRQLPSLPSSSLNSLRWWVECLTWWWVEWPTWWWAPKCHLTWLLSNSLCISNKSSSCSSSTCNNFGCNRCSRPWWWVTLHKSQVPLVKCQIRCQCSRTWCPLECHREPCGHKVCQMEPTRTKVLTRIEVEISDQLERLLYNYQLVQTSHILAQIDPRFNSVGLIYLYAASWEHLRLAQICRPLNLNCISQIHIWRWTFQNQVLLKQYHLLQ